MGQTPEPGVAAALLTELREAALDPDTCHRIRDLQFNEEDAKFYLTDGFLIFGKPVHGKRLFAVFASRESSDDAELLLRPPNPSERRSLASFTGSPNMNEHFKTAVFVFTDDTAEQLMKIVRESPLSKPHAEMGLLLATEHGGTVRNLLQSFAVRVVYDLLSGAAADRGMFYAALAGVTFGNFDLLHDPVAREQIVVGQISTKNDARGEFVIWASFESRSSRTKRVEIEEPVFAERYSIRAELGAEPELNLSVVSKISLKLKAEARGALALEIAPQMRIEEAKLNGAPVEIFRRESLRDALIRGARNDIFLVLLPAPLAAGQSVELEIKHSGDVISSAGNGVYYVAARTNWYPSRGMDFAMYDLEFRVPKHLNLVATGDLQEEVVEGEWRIVRRRTSAPVRLAGFNVGSYERASVKKGEYEVEVFANKRAEAALQPRGGGFILMPPAFQRGGLRRPSDVVAIPAPPPPDSTARLTELANEIGSALDWMAGVFGPPPLKVLTVSPIPGSFGQGFPGLLYLSTYSFLANDQRPGKQQPNQQVFYSEILHAHETAHQWWGNLLTSGTYHDEWIQEALANYSALLVLEKKKGLRALEEVLDGYLKDLTAKQEGGDTIESSGPITWGIRLYSKGEGVAWRAITYEKGSWIFHMLRRRMGDAKFLEFLGTLRKEYAYKSISTEQLRLEAAKFMPKDSTDPTLELFFDQWVYATGIPTLSVTSVYKGKAGVGQLTVTVRQTGVAEDFSVDVPLEVRVTGKPVITRWIRTSNEPVVITVPVRGLSPKVDLAPGGAVLALRK